MSSLYDMLALNDEIMNLHRESLEQFGDNNEDTLKIIEMLGGVDYVLANLLQQHALGEQQLSALKTLFAEKCTVATPSIAELDVMLEEIDGAGKDADHSNLDVALCEHGHAQSPINIVSSVCGTTKVMPDEEFESNPLRFDYPSKVENCTILNNGHTVQVNIDESQECSLTIHGKTFWLKQFHFHTPSEHTFDSKQYEMEMHLVHLNEDNEIAVLGFIFTTQQTYQRPKLKLSKSRAHLVLSQRKSKATGQGDKHGFLSVSVVDVDDEETSDDLDTDDEFEVAEPASPRKEKNDFLAQFWDELPVNKTTEDIPLKKALSFDYLFESSSNRFKRNVETNSMTIDMEIFEYMGSLTTPPYTEGVQWLVSKKTHFINPDQLKKLSACWNDHNNARPVQKYFGRTVSLRSKSNLRLLD